MNSDCIENKYFLVRYPEIWYFLGKNGMLLREKLRVCLLANPSHSLKGYFTAVCFIQGSVHFPIKSSYTLFSHNNTLLNNVI